MQYQVEQAELNVRGVISETKKALIQAKKNAEHELRKQDFDYVSYSEAIEDAEMLEKGLEKAQKFLNEMF